MKEGSCFYRWFVPAAAVLLFSIGSSAQASALFNDLNANPLSKYDCCSSSTIEGASTAQYFAQGFSFTPSATESLSQVDIALQIFGGTDSVVVTLNADSSGFPGAALETWNVSGLPSPATCCTLQSLAPGVPLTLSSAATYWLVATPGAADTFTGWNLNNTSSTGPRAVQTSSGGAFSLFGANDTRGAFDVIGTAAPEPASIALAMTGLAMLCLRLRRSS